MTTHIRHNIGVFERDHISKLNVRSYSQEEMDLFVSKRPDLLIPKKNKSNHKEYRKSNLHNKMNKEALEYFKEYAEQVKDPKLCHITISFDYRTMCSLSPNDRPDFVREVYGLIWLRMHTKLGIKKPKKIRPEYDKYIELPRIYEVVEDRDKWGQPTFEHYHLVCAIHPKHQKKVNELYWSSVGSSPRSFIFGNQSYSCEDVIKSIKVQDIEVPIKSKGYAYWKDWSQLEAVIDYDNKQASMSRELFSSFSPIKEKQTHGFRKNNTTEVH